MFEGFQTSVVHLDDSEVFVRHGGSGPAVVLLHGHPRTSSTWHWVAPGLVERGFTVVCPDLRGYGRSRGPAPTPDHAAHSKRAMAADILGAVRRLGIERFHLAGHDRGSYVAFRLAMDDPGVVDRLALLDCIPISEHLRRITPGFATRWFHWFFFAQPETPERVINADPDSWYAGGPEELGDENYAEFRAATRDPDVVRAMLEDYRAGLTVDRRDEEEDRDAGRRLRPPLLVAWSAGEDLDDLGGDPVEVWKTWADDVRGGAVIDSSHHMAEEAPEQLVDVLAAFFGAEG
ncbi:alpha/beta hydrolase [Mumia sp. zg.B17]|uniref:alpha/beta fold hydrolase n=1 Tax=Mumia sp. zg.B17 TaxID=2855446 RepID=UPI001C6F4A33|nr:alpha/beta hydrolase [Mumia sp. zg.B17]MBW9204430.1 alpha/beta hydrolase [Mumia sp. zg.B17]